MRVVTWNLNKRNAIQAQVEALAARTPQVVAFQEVKAKHLAPLRDLLAGIGLPHVIDSAAHGAHTRRGYVVIASAYPLTRLKFRLDACPESALGVRMQAGDRPIDIYAVHVPTFALNAETKIDFMLKLYEHLAHRRRTPRISVRRFQQPAARAGGRHADHVRADAARRWRVSHPQRWAEHDAAERAMLTGLARL